MVALVEGVRWPRRVKQWLLQRREADLVIAPEWGGAAAQYAACARRTPLVTQLHTSAAQVRAYSEHRRRPAIRSALPSLLTDRREMSQTFHSDAVLGCSSAVLRDTLERWNLTPNITGVLPNVLNIELIRKLADGPSPSLPEGRYVLFFGRLEQLKGVHTLADAMRPILARHPDVFLVLAGTDHVWKGQSMVEQVRRLAGPEASRVIYLGPLSPKSLMPLIRVSDVVALPSLWEAFSTAIIEAMALGRPLVTTAGQGADDVIADGEQGLLVPKEDPVALERAIDLLLVDSAFASRLGAGAALRAEEYGPGPGATRASRIFAEVLAQVRSPASSSASARRAR